MQRVAGNSELCSVRFCMRVRRGLQQSGAGTTRMKTSTSIRVSYAVHAVRIPDACNCYYLQLNRPIQIGTRMSSSWNTCTRCDRHGWDPQPRSQADSVRACPCREMLRLLPPQSTAFKSPAMQDFWLGPEPLCHLPQRAPDWPEVISSRHAALVCNRTSKKNL